MTTYARSLLSLACLFVLSAPALGQEPTEVTATPVPKDETAAAPAAEAQAEAAPVAVEAVVRGLFVEGRVGGGYMVKNTELVVDRTRYPEAPANEPLGLGTTVQMALGYDLTDAIALQGFGGATLVSAWSAREPVRDLGLVFGGVGVRGAFPMSDRLHVTGAAGIGYVSARNEVESPESGGVACVDLGVEYFVHVRHFSVGLLVSGLVPFSPMRAFIGLAPTLKYTFF